MKTSIDRSSESNEGLERELVDFVHDEEIVWGCSSSRRRESSSKWRLVFSPAREYWGSNSVAILDPRGGKSLLKLVCVSRQF